MSELVKMSVDIHIFFVFTTALIAAINLFIVKRCDEYIKMTKRYEFFSPLYYLSLSVVIFTGSVVLAVFKFDIKFVVYFMISTSLVIIISGFKTHKFFKKTRVKDLESQVIFRNFATKKYSVDIVLIFITAALSFMLDFR